MDIAQVAKRSNLPASTIRFYEEKGLIESIGRNGLRRVFAESVIDRLAFISLGQASGLTLDEIAKMLSPNAIDVDRNLLVQKADEIDARIKRLTAMRNGLRHAAVCPAPNHFECPKFLRLLKIAQHRWVKERKG